MRRLALLSLLAAACGSETDDRPAEWGYISAAIIQPNCATVGCHSEWTSAGGVRLDDETSGWVSLVEAGFVVEGDSDASMLVHLLRANETWRMPPSSPLPERDIELIERWIDEGAAR